MSEKSLNRFINFARWIWDNRDKIGGTNPPKPPPFFGPEDDKKFKENVEWLNKEMKQKEKAQSFKNLLALHAPKYIPVNEQSFVEKYQAALQKNGKVSIEDLKKWLQ